MSVFERHVLNVNGNLKKENGVLTIKLAWPQVKFNLWQIRLTELTIVIKNEALKNNKLCALTCNFVKETKFNLTNEPTTFYPYLNFFDVKGEKEAHKITRFDENWRNITNFEEELSFSFFDIKMNKKFQDDCDVFVIAEIKRVK